jgi:hypothetical protein
MSDPSIHLNPAGDDPGAPSDDSDRIEALEKRCEQIERLLYLLGGEGGNAFLAELKRIAKGRGYASIIADQALGSEEFLAELKKTG